MIFFQVIKQVTSVSPLCCNIFGTNLTSGRVEVGEVGFPDVLSGTNIAILQTLCFLLLNKHYTAGISLATFSTATTGYKCWKFQYLSGGLGSLSSHPFHAVAFIKQLRSKIQNNN